MRFVHRLVFLSSRFTSPLLQLFPTPVLPHQRQVLGLHQLLDVLDDIVHPRISHFVRPPKSLAPLFPGWQAAHKAK